MNPNYSFATRVLAGKLFNIPSCDVNEYQCRIALKASNLYRKGNDVPTIVKLLGIKPVTPAARPALMTIREIKED